MRRMHDEGHRGTDVAELIAVGRDHEAARRGADHDTTTGGHMDPLAQLDLLAPQLGKVVAGITPDDLDRPTPCADFDVRGVLEHMIGGAAMFAAAYRGTPPAEPDTSDPLAAFGPALGELAAAITAPGALDRTVASPFGDINGETFARFIVLDGLVHGWDLATATGQPYDPPAALVDPVAEFAQEAVEHLRDGVSFGPAEQAPTHATPMEQLAAFTGRRIEEER
jgi:uncharacterized protein (TIGR03086 family)